MRRGAEGSVLDQGHALSREQGAKAAAALITTGVIFIQLSCLPRGSCLSMSPTAFLLPRSDHMRCWSGTQAAAQAHFQATCVELYLDQL